jgi:NADP-dependent 3-hydroxy acid dehydrogenase YdfG
MERMIDVNIRGFTYVAWKCAPFIARSSGHIFNLGSIAGAEAYE